MTTILGPLTEKVEVSPGLDRCFRFVVPEDGREQKVEVAITGSAMSCGPAGLPSPVGRAVATCGLSLVERAAAAGALPERFEVTTTTVSPLI